MFARSGVVLCVALALMLGQAGTSSASIVVTFKLGTPVVVGNEATIPVGLDFPGGPTDDISVIQINVADSDPLLTADFSRFSFDFNPVVLPGWSDTGFDPLGFSLLFPDILGPNLGPGDHNLGSLTVDLSGIPTDTLLKVSIMGGTPGFDETTVDGNLMLSGVMFDPGMVEFRSVATIPEPASLVTWGGLALGLLVLVRRRRTAHR